MCFGTVLVHWGAILYACQWQPTGTECHACSNMVKRARDFWVGRHWGVEHYFGNVMTDKSDVYAYTVYTFYFTLKWWLMIGCRKNLWKPLRRKGINICLCSAANNLAVLIKWCALHLCSPAADLYCFAIGCSGCVSDHHNAWGMHLIERKCLVYCV